MIHAGQCFYDLFQHFFNSFIDLIDRFHVVGLDRVNDAVIQMFLQDQLGDPVDLTAHRRELYENIRTVLTALHHPLDGFQVADRLGKAVEDPADMFRIVCMCMRMRMGMIMRMSV